jgi:hypothetical protein
MTAAKRYHANASGAGQRLGPVFRRKRNPCRQQKSARRGVAAGTPAIDHRQSALPARNQRFQRRAIDAPTLDLFDGGIARQREQSFAQSRQSQNKRKRGNKRKNAQ